MLRCLAILVTVLALGPVPAEALAASRQDATSTHTALVAAYAALHAIVDTWPTEEASLHRLELRFAAECPGVGAGSPQSESEQKLSYEVAGSLWATGYHTDTKIAQAFIKAVGPLRWSNPTLTSHVHRYIMGLREMIALQVPDLCCRRALMDRKRIQDDPGEHVAIRPARGSDRGRSPLARADRPIRAARRQRSPRAGGTPDHQI